jgi:hypothetical protein
MPAFGWINRALLFHNNTQEKRLIMSEKVLSLPALSPNQAAALVTSIPPRLFKALPLVTTEFGNALMRDTTLLDLWVWKILGLSLRRDENQCIEERLRVHVSREMLDKHCELFFQGVQPLVTKSELILSNGPTGFSAYHDVKIFGIHERVALPDSFCFLVILRPKLPPDRDNNPPPGRFVVEEAYNYWAVECGHQGASLFLEKLLHMFWLVKRG